MRCGLEKISILLNEVVAEILIDQNKFFVLHRFVIKVTRFQLPTLKRFNIAIKTFWGAIMFPMSNRAKSLIANILLTIVTPTYRSGFRFDNNESSHLISKNSFYQFMNSFKSSDSHLSL